jgi:hypothetical protein
MPFDQQEDPKSVQKGTALKATESGVDWLTETNPSPSISVISLTSLTAPVPGLVPGQFFPPSLIPGDVKNPVFSCQAALWQGFIL